MSRAPLARLGFAVLAVVLATTGLATPARAAAEQGTRHAAETGTIHGEVTDSAGAPAAGATVEVYTADDEDWELLKDTTTDAAGRFTVGDVRAGTVKVKVTNAGLAQWAPGKVEREQATAFTVSAGQTLTLDERLLGVGTITGRLTDSAGAPLVNAEVHARPLDFSGVWPRTRTDQDGRYAIHVFPGGYRVMFEYRGMSQWVPGQRDEHSATTFAVAADRHEVADDALLPTGGLGGKLVDAAGRPVAGARVSLEFDGSWAGSTTTDGNGNYSFARVLAGAYTLSFQLTNGAVQWVPGARAFADAKPFPVTAGQRTTVNETLIATGAVAGRFTDARGNGLAGFRVALSSGDVGDGSTSFTTETDAQGNYRIDDVFVGRYLVAFEERDGGRRQYAYGKGNRDDADRITVKAGETATVNDTRVAGARLRVTAKDARTGAPVSDFCVDLLFQSQADHSGCTTGAELVFDNLAAGPYGLWVTPGDDGLYLRTEADTTLTAGQSAAVSVPLTLGGAIQATVTDRVTGQPVADACLLPLAPAEGGPGEGSGVCTDAQGRVRTYAVEPGTYALFASAPSESPYGHQWVGRSGGTGDQRAAARITVRAGAVATAPAVRFDRAGTVSGTVTGPDGKPVTSGNVSYSAWDFGAGPSHGTHIEDDGRYTLSGLGPYEWPLLFTVDGVARQWSGGVANRFKAAKVRVRSDATTGYNAVLKVGTTVRGTVRLANRAIGSGRLTAYHPVTGDPMGKADFGADGVYTMRVPGSEPIILHHGIEDSAGRPVDGWYDGVAEPARARRVPVPASGQKTLNITIR
ncbi:MAG TPA: carboxypeptidase-like regulatory domain-containing protein [Catenuloplanes sp.]|jgi:hypothetical protein